MLSILVATYPLAGHVGPLRPIVRELVARGHRVRWYTGARFGPTVRDTGAEFVSMAPDLDRADLPLDEEFPERAKLSGLKKIRWDLRNIFIGPAAEQVAELQALLDEGSTDVIVCDPGVTGVSMVSELEGIPFVTIGITPLALPAPGLAPFGPGLQPAMSPLGKVRNFLLTSLLERVVYSDGKAYLNDIRVQLGLAPVTGDLIASMFSPYLHLQVGVPELEHPRPVVPDHVQFVGALNDSSTGIARPTWWEDVVTATCPVVHVTQGTVANDNFDDLLLPTIRALADEDVLVVATAGGSELPVGIQLPANARIAPMLPYDDLLPRTSVLVTNGGYGTVNQVLAHGIPVVVAGTTEDKPEVGARIRGRGLGIDLRTSRPSEIVVRSAVREVVREPQYRRRAAELAESYRSRNAGTLSADAIENLCIGRSANDD